MRRFLFGTALTLCALVAARIALAEPRRLEDGTTADRWTLPNGLEVVARDVPGARAISVTWGYRFGLDHDSRDRPGLASLLAEVAFTAPTGESPERTRDEMESLRPSGWSLRVNRRQTMFTETAAPGQFAGVLRQVAVRMRGVTVTRAGLRSAVATVRRMHGERYFGTADQMLYWQVREYARGLDKAGIVALAAAKELDRETPASVRQAIARAYVPANGVLAVAGDLSHLDLRSVVMAEFGALPAGTRLPDPPVSRLDSATVVLERPEVKEPVGVLGFVAPALTDTLHPPFFMAMLMLGTHARQAWGPTAPPLGTRFQYALLDEPDLVRFYPKPAPEDASSPPGLFFRFREVLMELLEAMTQRDLHDAYRHNVLWMLGGPMSKALVENVRGEAAALNALCVSIAEQALWGSEAFWAEYRRRCDFSVSPGISHWTRWLTDPRHRATLLLAPKR